MHQVSELLRQERPAWTAWLILVGVFGLATLQRSAETPGRPGPSVASFIFWQAVHLGYAVFLVRYIRGTSRGPNLKPPYLPLQLGTWGYVWRTLVVTFLQAPLAVLVFFAVDDAGLRVTLSVLISFFVPPALCWVLFGWNRMATIKACLGFRG